MNWPDVAGSVALGAAGALLLWGCYRAVEIKWPDRYAGMTQTFALRARQTLGRFVTFRCLPTALVVVIVSLTCERVVGAPGAAVIGGAVAALPSVLVHGYVFGRSMVKGGDHTVNYGIFHLAMALMIAIAALAALPARVLLGPLVPQPEVLLDSIWAALIAVGIGGAAVAVLRPRPPDAPEFGPRYWIDRAKRDTGVAIFDRAFEVSRERGADPLLVWARLVGEVVQRPRWMRWLEFQLARWRPATSVGVMQVPGSEAKTDIDSVDVGVSQMAGRWALVATEYGYATDYNSIWTTATEWNAEADYVDRVYSIHAELLSGCSEPSGWPGVLIETRRYPGRIALRGITSADRVACADPSRPDRQTEVSPSRRSDDGLWAFEIDVPLGVSTLELTAHTEVEGLVTQVVLSRGELSWAGPAEIRPTTQPRRDSWTMTNADAAALPGATDRLRLATDSGSDGDETDPLGELEPSQS